MIHAELRDITLKNELIGEMDIEELPITGQRIRVGDDLYRVVLTSERIEDNHNVVWVEPTDK